MLWAEKKSCTMLNLIDRKVLPLILTVLLVHSCHSGFPTVEVDTLYSNQSLRDGQFLGLENGKLRLGFFAPNKSSENRYLGIWQNTSSDPSEIWYLWVANRDDPLTDTTGVLKFDEVTSNLVLIDTRRNRILWSTNCDIGITSNVSAKLHIYGNLVLQNSNGDELWSSFDDLGDTFLPGAEMSFDLRTKKKNTLTSWKSLLDPSSGPFRFDILGSTKLQRAFVFDGWKPYFRLGPWIGGSFICVPDMPSSELYRFRLYVNATENEDVIRFKYDFYFGDGIYVWMMLVLESDGHLDHRIWSQGSEEIESNWKKPEDECDSYGFCGKFATCHIHKISRDGICRCMEGFRPRSRLNWDRGIFSGGCEREKELACERRNAGNNLTNPGEDRFLKHQNLKLPDGELLRNATNESQCRNLCAEDCECVAYAYVKKQHCLVWKEDLLDMRVIDNGQVLYVKLNPSHDSSTGMPKTNKHAVIIICIVSIAIQFLLSSNEEDECINTEPNEEDQELGDIFRSQTPKTEFRQNGSSIMRTATGDLNVGNKLGEGSFCQAYKGILLGGQDIAVKRPLNRSTHGIKGTD